MRIHLALCADCGGACKDRCSLSSRPHLCNRACGTCCARCKCVPKGTSGNLDTCPCYATMTTHGGRRKCPWNQPLPTCKKHSDSLHISNNPWSLSNIAMKCCTFLIDMFRDVVFFSLPFFFFYCLYYIFSELFVFLDFVSLYFLYASEIWIKLTIDTLG
jgi:hypothetical protein